ncbi:hypothetical protein GIB67_016290 [Kingdonia uniflora]|uniref:Uncharacterized protein n=1 Tax=Kingdonia uniflora TaxID=39325 RepID=A0A7J7M9Q3_9MAGN|nr:hypothetical protein GIB67_016290 [Kingdonia uniflora]
MFKDKTKNRVDDLQGVFTNFQSARKGRSGNGEVSTLEEQVQQMLREWKAELEELSPASSLQSGSGGGGSRFTLSSELHRLLHPCEQGDEATSVLREPAKPKSKPDVQNFQGGDFNDNAQFEEDGIPKISGMRPSVLPSSAFLGPKCALWDYPRPAQVSKFSQDYCSDYHGGLALTEGPPGMSQILRLEGIAATTKFPWNAPELFDLSILEQETGESIGESSPLFEYEIINCDACALYRLEFKNVQGKKSPKGKVTNDPLSDLQKQMGRLTAVPVDNKWSVKGRTKACPKGHTGANTYSTPNQATSSNQNFSYEGDGSYGYLVDNLSDNYEG